MDRPRLAYWVAETVILEHQTHCLSAVPRTMRRATHSYSLSLSDTTGAWNMIVADNYCDGTATTARALAGTP